MAQWAAAIAADLAHLTLGSRPQVLVSTSLAGSLAGFGALYGCLRQLHPLMDRMARAESALRGTKGKGKVALLKTGKLNAMKDESFPSGNRAEELEEETHD